MIDTHRLRDELPSRRWFGGKGRAIERVEIIDHARIAETDRPLILAIARVTFTDGEAHLYHLPLLVSSDGSATDALGEADALRVVGELMAHSTTFDGEHGVFRFAGPGLDPLAPPTGRVRPLGAEQTNSSVVFDDADIVVKFFRRVHPGSNPDVELGRYLTNAAFEHIPAHVGELSYESDDTIIDLAVAQQFVRDSEEGWTYVVRRLHAFFDEIHPQDAAEDRRFLTEERAGSLLGSIEELADVIASLHVALAREEGDPEFAPEPLEGAELKTLVEAVRASLRGLVDAGVSELDALSDDIETRLDLVLGITSPGDRLRVHGDLHLGQVLLSGRGWLLLDFEGEPARALVERRTKQSPLKDVAGMLRSFNYAAVAALFERAQPNTEEWDRLQPWADEWEGLARQRFTSRYVSHAVTEGTFLPEERDDIAILLDAYEIDKAVYEIGYERAHRPDWVRIPLQGIARLVGEGRLR